MLAAGSRSSAWNKVDAPTEVDFAPSRRPYAAPPVRVRAPADGADARIDDPRYLGVELLGEGGMGRVERARDRDLGRDVAVKTIRPELEVAARMLERFLFEARVTAYLDHPNIVPVHDVGTRRTGDRSSR